MTEELESLDIESIDDAEPQRGALVQEDEEEPKWKPKYLQWRNNVTSGTYNVTNVLGSPEIILDDGVNQIRLSDILGYQLPNKRLSAFVESNDLSEAEFSFMNEDLMLKVGDSWKSIFEILDMEPVSVGGKYKRMIIKSHNDDKNKMVL